MKRIPKRFFDDHEERALPSPDIIKQNKTAYWIVDEGEGYDELLDDAKYYADSYGPDDNCGNIKRAAIALLKAVAR
jgi:hypothetical protein